MCFKATKTYGSYMILYLKIANFNFCFGHFSSTLVEIVEMISLDA